MLLCGPTLLPKIESYHHGKPPLSHKESALHRCTGAEVAKNAMIVVLYNIFQTSEIVISIMRA